MEVTNTSNMYCFHITLEDFKQEPDYLSTIYTINCVLHSLFAIITIFGNTTILVSIWRTPAIFSPSTLLLALLTLSDLAVGSLVQLVYLPYKLAELNHNYRIVCGLRVLFNLAGFFQSLFSCFVMTAISVEKYLAIYYHLRYQAMVTVRRVVFVSLCLVLTATAATVLVAMHEIVFLVAGLLIFACSVIVLFANVQLLRNMRYHHLQIQDLERSVRSSQRPKIDTSSSENANNLSVIRYRKSVFTISYIVLAMLVCYLPYLCSILARSVVEYPNNIVRLTLNITHMITFANSALNPYLYYWRIRELRGAVKKTLMCSQNSS